MKIDWQTFDGEMHVSELQINSLMYNTCSYSSHCKTSTVNKQEIDFTVFSYQSFIKETMIGGF